MQVTLSTHVYRWTCTHCGEVEDRSVELHVENKLWGRWFEDGHHGVTQVDDNAIEFFACQGLSISFLELEQVRAIRSQNRQGQTHPSLSLLPEDLALFDQLLLRHGHIVQRRRLVFVPAQSQD